MKPARWFKLALAVAALFGTLTMAAPGFAWSRYYHGGYYRPYYRPYYGSYYRPYYYGYYPRHYGYYAPYYNPFYFPGFSFYIGP